MTYTSKARKPYGAQKRTAKQHGKRPELATKTKQKGRNTSANRRMKSPELDQIFQSFQQSIEDIHEKFALSLQTRVSCHKSDLNTFQTDSKKQIQQATQQTIKQLTVLGQLKARQAKRRDSTVVKFQKKERELKSKLSHVNRSTALAQRLSDRLDELDDFTDDEDEYISE